MPRPLHILYGSATGNSEHIAKDLASTCEKFLASKPSDSLFYGSVVCRQLDEWKKAGCVEEWEDDREEGAKHKTPVIIVCSTTGNGDSPENAGRFTRFLKRKSTKTTLPFRNVCYGVLALGDSNYDRFCYCGQEIDKGIANCGGMRVRNVVLADEATGLEDVVEPWVAEIMNCFGSHMGLEENVVAVKPPKVDKKSQMEAILGGARSVPTAPTPPPVSEKRAVTILYGGETAYDIARSVKDKTDKSTIVVDVVNMKDFKAVGLGEEVGEGDEMKRVLCILETVENEAAAEDGGPFLRYLKRKSHPTTLLANKVEFGVLGLGNSNLLLDRQKTTAKDCNKAGQTMDKRLEELGGRRWKTYFETDERTEFVGLDQWIAEAAKFEGENLPSLPTTVTATATATATASARPPLPPPLHKTTRSEMTGLEILTSLSFTKILPRISEAEMPSMITSSHSSCQLLGVVDAKKADSTDDGGANVGAADDLVNSSMTESSFAGSYDNDGTNTITSSDSNVHYSLNKPYAAPIVGAKYLTKSDRHVAGIAADAMFASSSSGEPGLCYPWKAVEKIEEMTPILMGENVDQITAEDNQKRVVEIEISLPTDFSLEYSPGDSIGVIVENDRRVVDIVLSRLNDKLGVGPSELLLIDETSEKMTVEECMLKNVDITAQLKKRAISSLSQYCSDAAEENALKLLASKTPEGERLYVLFVEKQRLNFGELLLLFPSLAPPLDAILSIFSNIAPRFYSVTTSPLQKINSLKFAFSVVNYVTDNGLTRERRKGGLATTYMEALCSPFLALESPHTIGYRPTIKVFPKTAANFRLPANSKFPLILIGPGTGVAPFMGFLQHRQLLKDSRIDEASKTCEGSWRGGFDFGEGEVGVGIEDGSTMYHTGLSIGPVELFFGCRRKDHDWIYEREMKEFQFRSILTSLDVAFSRPNEEGEKKAYVQDRLLIANKDGKIKRLIQEENAYIYICGDGAGMAKGVVEALVDILGGGVDGGGKEEGERQIKELKKRNRIVLDIWTL
mgnify:FL=1